MHERMHEGHSTYIMKDFIFDEHDSLNDEQIKKIELVEQKAPRMKRNIFGVVVLLLMIALGSSVYWQRHTGSRSSAADTLSAMNTAQATSSIQDAIILTINGEPIKRKIYSLSINNILQLAQNQKLDVNDKNIQQQIQNLALANVVNTALLVQKAKEAGLTVDEAKVDESFRSIASKAGDQAKLDKNLEDLGMTSDELRTAIGNELLATQFLDSTIDAMKVNVTEGDLKKYYDAQVAKLTGKDKIPAYMTIKAKLQEELITKKKQEQVQTYLLGLRSTARIAAVSDQQK